ncbi:acetylcholinesterase-like isoform X2 [Ornithodoros turicata]|uniref:acetylcholinesterase-like isoform X2 n=1 Tax=Ornithodoros turicata TaxID=34597 RepID=UPI003138656B
MRRPVRPFIRGGDSLCSRCHLARMSSPAVRPPTTEHSGTEIAPASSSEVGLPADQLADDTSPDEQAHANRRTSIYLAIAVLAMLLVSFLLSHLSRAFSYRQRLGHTIVINTTWGQITGTIVDGSIEFLQIPFARPLVKSDRFKWALPNGDSNNSRTEGDRTISCMQMVGEPYGNAVDREESLQENCLYLSIWCPAVHGNMLPYNKSVLFYLHGGFFTIGSNDRRLGRKLAAQEGIIVVAANYRLDVFGFLRTDSTEAPGNVGLRDQLLALNFVRKHIVKFGGNPHNITLAGHDAGAASLGFHLFRRDSFWNNTAKRIVLMGGSPINGLMDCSVVAMRKFARLATITYCRKSASGMLFPSHEVPCLRELEANALLETLRGGFEDLPVFLPIYGDDILPDHPVNLMNKNRFSGKALLVGTVFTDPFNVHDLTWSILTHVGKNRTALLKSVMPDVNGQPWPEFSNRNPVAVELTIDKASVVRSFRWKPCSNMKAGILESLKHQVATCSTTA